ncbi:MAG: DUF3298 domain-containing protein [Clostridia bacterium]|nr:DUF3298 domain-containing protein [Clostridia bacterium]
MDPNMQRARERYENTEIPQELPFTVASAVRDGSKRRKSPWKAARRSLAAFAACCACFAVLVNTSPTFAAAVADVPVLRGLARIFTVREFSMHDDTRLIDVRLPALENTGHTDLEQRVNTEITTRIDAVLAEARERAQFDYEAFISTGGKAEDFIPVNIAVNYAIKCQNERYLSFVLTTAETQANVYTTFTTYNIDLTTGKEFTLSDLLGPGWKDLSNEAVRSGIAKRTAEDPMNSYFDGSDGIEGFTTVSDQQKFYLNDAGNPVILFEKYEIAPGYMGIQEFEVPAVK